MQLILPCDLSLEVFKGCLQILTFLFKRTTADERTFTSPFGQRERAKQYISYYMCKREFPLWAIASSSCDIQRLHIALLTFTSPIKTD